jgi:predicted nuclease of predicted toxin-antitoxin system
LRLLLDQNLSAADLAEGLGLNGPLAAAYLDLAHVRDFALERADDTTVWNFAKDNGFAIVSKDSAFHQRSLVFGHPPKVVWPRLGNCSTSNIEVVLREQSSIVASFLEVATASLLSLSRSS